MHYHAIVVAGLLAAAACPHAPDLPAQPQSAAEWRQFRGPSGQGVTRNKGLPLAWNQDQNLAWKTPLPGPGGSSPVVFGERVYLTCYSGFAVPGTAGGDVSALQLHLVCLDRTDGRIVWTTDVPAVQPEQTRVRDHGYASSTPPWDRCWALIPTPANHSGPAAPASAGTWCRAS